ncbi:MAG: hypothetical protein FWG98_02420 [Candidatus Cloacimonetes bacterium]|nr:hypothetical protein [Candidatus Cloacimonadota bacterium]
MSDISNEFDNIILSGLKKIKNIDEDIFKKNGNKESVVIGPLLADYLPQPEVILYKNMIDFAVSKLDIYFAIKKSSDKIYEIIHLIERIKKEICPDINVAQKIIFWIVRTLDESFDFQEIFNSEPNNYLEQKKVEQIIKCKSALKEGNIESAQLIFDSIIKINPFLTDLLDLERQLNGRLAANYKIEYLEISKKLINEVATYIYEKNTPNAERLLLEAELYGILTNELISLRTTINKMKVEILCSQASIDIQNNDFDKAERLIEDAGRIDESNEEITNLKTKLNAKKAENICDQAASEINQNNFTRAEILLNQAELLNPSEQNIGSLRNLLNGLVDQKDSNALCDKAEIEISNQDFAVAKSLLKLAFKKYNNNDRVKYLRIKIKKNELNISLNEIKNEIEHLNFKKAQELINNIKQNDTNQDIIQEIENDLTNKEEARNSFEDEIKLHIENGLLYKAQNCLDIFKATHFPKYSNPEIEDKINIKLSIAKETLQKAETARKEDDIAAKIEYSLQAYFLCSDLPGAWELLEQPKLVFDIDVDCDSNIRENRISWKSTYKSSAKYRIVRKEKSFSSADIVSEELGIVPECYYIDSYNLKPNTVYVYGIETLFYYEDFISPKTSGFIKSAEYINLFEVKNDDVDISLGNNEISFYIKNKPENSDIEVWKGLHADIAEQGQGTEIIAKNNEFIDKNVDYDTNYFYGIYLKYQQGNKNIFSKVLKYLLYVPPAPVENIEIKHLSDNKFEISWDPTNEVELYSNEVEKGIDIKKGDILTVQDFESKGFTKIKLHTNSFDLPDSKAYYVFPIKIKNGYVVIGKLLPATTKPLISSIPIQELNNELSLLFSYPEYIDRIILLYDTERHIDIKDNSSGSCSIELSREEYMTKGGLKIPKANSYYFNLYYRLKNTEEFIYALPLKDTYPKKQLEINYTITPKRRFFLGKLTKIVLNIYPASDDNIPPLTVRGNKNMLPTHNNGFEIYSFSGQISSQEIKIDLPIKFFNSKKNYLDVFVDEEYKVFYKTTTKSNRCIRA